MQARLTMKPKHEVLAAIQALDLESVKLRVMDAELGEGWTREYADSIEAAYKTYLTMLVKYPDDAEDIRLSKDVDEFWHTHILHTMKYAEDCQKVFGNFLHHNPHIGERTLADMQKQAVMTEKTRRLYQRELEAAQGTEATWAGANIRTERAAYCGAAVTAKKATYCGAAIAAEKAAYCGAAVTTEKPAYCGAAVTAKKATYCGAAIAAEKAAYCGAAVTTEKPAYCGQPSQPRRQRIAVLPSRPKRRRIAVLPSRPGSQRIAVLPSILRTPTGPGLSRAPSLATLRGLVFKEPFDAIVGLLRKGRSDPAFPVLTDIEQEGTEESGDPVPVVERDVDVSVDHVAVEFRATDKRGDSDQRHLRAWSVLIRA